MPMMALQKRAFLCELTAAEKVMRCSLNVARYASATWFGVMATAVAGGSAMAT